MKLAGRLSCCKHQDEYIHYEGAVLCNVHKNGSFEHAIWYSMSNFWPFSLLSTLSDFYAYFLVETILSSFWRSFAWRVLSYISAWERTVNRNWKKSIFFVIYLHLCTILIVPLPNPIILNIYMNVLLSPYIFLKNIYFVSQEFTPLDSTPRVQFKCIISTIFISIKEKNVCCPCTVATSWLGYTDMVESLYYTFLLYFHYCKKRYYGLLRDLITCLLKPNFSIIIS